MTQITTYMHIRMLQTTSECTTQSITLSRGEAKRNETKKLSLVGLTHSPEAAANFFFFIRKRTMLIIIPSRNQNSRTTDTILLLVSSLSRIYDLLIFTMISLVIFHRQVQIGILFSPFFTT